MILTAAVPSQRTARRAPTPIKVRLASVAAALPSQVRTSAEVEAMILEASPGFRMRRGTIAAMTGIVARRVAADHEQCSDLAVDAARRAMADAGIGASEIDLLVFAAAGQDLIEPATSHIVQVKLGTTAQVVDVKNACNSFLNGIQVADALIRTGAIRTALVVTGEVCSRAIRWQVRDADEFRTFFPSYTMGDAGAAAVLTASAGAEGIPYIGFAARSAHWPLATIPAGGSMHPRGDEHAYLRGDGPALKDAFVAHGPTMLRQLLDEAALSLDDFDHIFVHQVGVPYHHEMLEAAGLEPERIECLVPHLGNMASASIPVAHAAAVARGTVRPGDRVMWLGMASGISVGVLVLETA